MVAAAEFTAVTVAVFSNKNLLWWPRYLNHYLALPVHSKYFQALYDNVQITTYTANVYRALRGVCRFSLQYLWKRAVRTTEKPDTPQRERLLMLWGSL